MAISTHIFHTFGGGEKGFGYAEEERGGIKLRPQWVEKLPIRAEIRSRVPYKLLKKPVLPAL